MMHGAKPSPKIATVDGKIYILGTKPHCGIHKIWHPAFECYDPSLGKWEQLPEPPHYDEDSHPSRASGLKACILSDYFVFGRKIYINNCFGLHYFDVDAKVWTNINSKLGVDRFTSPELPFYNRLNETTSIAQGDNGVVVAYTRGGLKAYLYGDDGELKLEERLCDVDDDSEPSDWSFGSVHFLGDGRFCIVLSGLMVREMYWGVRVTTFTVNVQGISDIKASILNSHEYEFSLRAPDSESYYFDNVFIAKGGEHELENPLIVEAYNRWFTFRVSGSLPQPRSEHGAAVIEDKMYVLGGAQGGIYLNDLHALDMSCWTWSKVNVKGSGEAALTARVAPCARPSLIPWKVDKLLLVDGYTKRPFKTIEVKMFDLKSSTWSTLNTRGRFPVSRVGQSVTLVKDKRLIVFGGKDVNGSLLNDTHILDLRTFTWDEIKRSEFVPCPRMDHVAAVHAARYLFIFGGRSDTACFNDLHVLDLKTMKWSEPSQKGEVPSPRTGHTCSVIGENWFIVGGEDEKGNGVPDTIIVLNMPTLVWSTLTSIGGSGPLGSKGLSLVTAFCRGQSILVSFGGFEDSGRCTNEVNVLRPWCRGTIEPVIFY